jgi:hypothetical protein
VSSLPVRTRDLATAWNHQESNLESVWLPYDFDRREPSYDPSCPLVLTKDAGHLALFEMRGVDPEPLGGDLLARVSVGLRRALEVFNLGNFDGPWRDGGWELQNIFTRGTSNAPLIPMPKRASAGEHLRRLVAASNEYWQARHVFGDRILWAVKFSPQNRDNRSLVRRLVSPVWRLLGANVNPLVALRDLQSQARFVRRVLEVFCETMRGVTTRRPRMDLGLRWLPEEECFQEMWRQVNRREGDAPALRRDLPLAMQVASSYRDNSGSQYEIDGRPTKILTWKYPPEVSVAYLFSEMQNQLRFPFTVAQNFSSLDFRGMCSGPLGLAMKEKVAGALRTRDGEEFVGEANHLMNAVFSEKGCVFQWYFAVIVSGGDLPELEARVTKISTLMKRLQGSEVLEERANRVLGELATLPGNSRYGVRYNLVTSRGAGDLAMAYRLSHGDKTPSMLFGDRQGGVYSYALKSRAESSWSKGVVGPPGSGKSVLMQSFVLGNAVVPSQGYVIDEGNSFGTLFEQMAEDAPGEVAVMRMESDSFQFNTCAFVWAMEERDKQIANGTYRMVLEDGTCFADPVEAEKLGFEAWLEVLLGQGEALPMDKKNRLDRALKGASGKGGFFREFENHCRRFLHERGRGRSDLPAPRPLSVLLTHLRSEAPEFAPAVELWTRPPRDRYFDSGRETMQRAKYVYFELTGLEKDPLLEGPFVAALMGTLWRRTKDPALIHETKGIWIDEAWKPLAKDAFFGTIDEEIRTSRKFNAFVVLGTQRGEDLQGNARKLLGSLSELFIYRGFAADPKFLSEDLGMTAHQIEQLKNLRDDEERREVFYVSKRGMNRILSVELPPALYWWVTTDAEDKGWRNLFCRRYGLSRGIDHLVAACEGKTVTNANDRVEKVRRYARKLELVREEERCA